VVPTTADDPRAVRVERYAVDYSVMTLERERLLAAQRVPQLNGVVPASADDLLAVRAERCRVRLPV